MITLPTGTVAFLFTDIEGSTRRLEAEPAACRADLGRHDAIVRRAVATHAGVIAQARGDGFCAAFESPTDALLSAFDAQGAMLDERWERPCRCGSGWRCTPALSSSETMSISERHSIAAPGCWIPPMAARSSSPRLRRHSSVRHPLSGSAFETSASIASANLPGQNASFNSWPLLCRPSFRHSARYVPARTICQYIGRRDAGGRAAGGRARPGCLSGVTRREQEVAALIARGLTNRQIAEMLVITEGTAANHVVHILNKLGYGSRSQIAAWATEHGRTMRSSGS